MDPWAMGLTPMKKKNIDGRGVHAPFTAEPFML